MRLSWDQRFPFPATLLSGACRVPVIPLELDRRHELAAFLRSRRARLSPEQAGLPRGTRRRTPGLRRGEVATLAGVSPEWYTWLEQGRDIHVSVQVLEAWLMPCAWTRTNALTSSCWPSTS